MHRPIVIALYSGKTRVHKTQRKVRGDEKDRERPDSPPPPRGLLQPPRRPRTLTTAFSAGIITRERPGSSLLSFFLFFFVVLPSWFFEEPLLMLSALLLFFTLFCSRSRQQVNRGTAPPWVTRALFIARFWPGSFAMRWARWLLWSFWQFRIGFRIFYFWAFVVNFNRWFVSNEFLIMEKCHFSQCRKKSWRSFRSFQLDKPNRKKFM